MTSSTLAYKGGTYEGELNAQKIPHGQGILKYSNGDSYKGQWQNGRPHGKGVAKGTVDATKANTYKKYAQAAYHQNAEVAQGEFTYDGEWKEGKMHGTGMYTFPNGDFYDGEWVNSVAQGTGMYIWQSTGNRYQGFWRNMMKHGTGTYCFKDGTKFDGVWCNDKRHGKGTETFANGNRFEGYWVNDKRHGIGYFTIQKSKENKRRSLKGSGSGSNRGSGLGASGYVIYEQVWEHGVKKSEKELDSFPSTFPEPPIELKDTEDLALEALDKAIANNKLEIDNVFVEGLIQWPDDNWKMIEELFITAFKVKHEASYHKSLYNKLQELEKGYHKAKELQALTDKLTVALEAGNKANMIHALGEVNKALQIDEDLPSEDVNDDILKMQVEVKIQKITSDIQELNNCNKADADELLAGKDFKARFEEYSQLLTELEKKTFRTDSSIATAKLHATSVGTQVKPEHPNYEDLAKIVALNLSRLREFVQQFAQEKLDSNGKPTDEKQKQKKMALLERIQERFKTTIVNLQDKASICGASPSSIIERSNRVIKALQIDVATN
jgi:tetratricopeptide (TPR) repeat protein